MLYLKKNTSTTSSLLNNAVKRSLAKQIFNGIPPVFKEALRQTRNSPLPRAITAGASKRACEILKVTSLYKRW